MASLPTESFFWITRGSFTTLLDNIVAPQAIVNIPAVITFDDGNASDAVIALPELLAKRGLKATFFVCEIGARRYLDRVALADLLAAGMEIGTHGKDHRNWRGLDEITLDDDRRRAAAH